MLSFLPYSVKVLIVIAYALFALYLIIKFIRVENKSIARKKNRLRVKKAQFNRENPLDATAVYVTLAAELPSISVSACDVLQCALEDWSLTEEPRFVPTDLSPTLHLTSSGQLTGTLDTPITQPVSVFVSEYDHSFGSRSLVLHIMINLPEDTQAKQPNSNSDIRSYTPEVSQFNLTRRQKSKDPWD